PGLSIKSAIHLASARALITDEAVRTARVYAVLGQAETVRTGQPRASRTKRAAPSSASGKGKGARAPSREILSVGLLALHRGNLVETSACRVSHIDRDRQAVRH